MHQVVGGAVLTDGVVFVVGGVSTFVGVISDELHSGSPSNLGVSAPGLSILGGVKIGLSGPPHVCIGGRDLLDIMRGGLCCGWGKDAGTGGQGSGQYGGGVPVVKVVADSICGELGNVPLGDA
jgi:hypothetical protein